MQAPRRYIGLRGKFIGLITGIVVISLIGSFYLHSQISQSIVEARLQDEARILAQELAAGIGSRRELEDPVTLHREIKQLIEIRKSLEQIDIFALTPDRELKLVASSERQAPWLRNPEAQKASIARGVITQVLRSSHNERFWEVTAPIHLEEEIIGSLSIKVSLKEADQVAAQERQYAVVTTVLTVLIMSIVLALFVQRVIYRPLQSLVGAMAGATAGDLTVEVQTPGQDELSQLGRHFNRMLKTIRDSTEERAALLVQLSQFNQELQRRVGVATQALAQRNEELMKANEALFEAQRRLTHWDRLSGMVHVVATVAHEIGNPLNSVAGHIRLLREDDTVRPEAQHRLKIVEGQLDRVAETLRTMLISMRQPEPQLAPLHLNTLLVEILSLMEPGLSSRHVRLVTQFQPDLPVIQADASQLQQVLLNLVTNALDAMPHGGELRIMTTVQGAVDEVQDGEGGRAWGTPQSPAHEVVVVQICDTGVGIPADLLPKIFDPFFTTKAVGAGTGIGLAVCQQILRMHHGTIEVVSQPQQGSTFRLTLPVQRGKE
jgi:signal transduction histidine kinase